MLFLLTFLIGSVCAEQVAPSRFQVEVASFNEYLVNPGVRVGAEWPLRLGRKGAPPTPPRDRFWAAGVHLGTYVDTGSHRAWLATGEFGRRRITRSRFILEYNVEAGYMASVLDGEAWALDGDDFVPVSRLTSHVVVGVNAGLGYTLQKQLGIPLAVGVKPHFFVQAPYNTAVLGRVAAEISLSYGVR
ncbi:MAG: hypothetical protein AAFV53_13700 [Myxococcota bacterium]